MLIDDAWESWVNGVGGEAYAVGFNHIPFPVVMEMLHVYVAWKKTQELPTAGEIEVKSWRRGS